MCLFRFCKLKLTFFYFPARLQHATLNIQENLTFTYSAALLTQTVWNIKHSLHPGQQVSQRPCLIRTTHSTKVQFPHLLLFAVFLSLKKGITFSNKNDEGGLPASFTINPLFPPGSNMNLVS